jgi:hypothetical protein
MVSVSCALLTTALLEMLRALSAKRSVARLSWKASATAATQQQHHHHHHQQQQQQQQQQRSSVL